MYTVQVIHCLYCINQIGTGGSIAGISKYLKEKDPKIKIVLGDPKGSSLANRINYGVLYTNEEAEGHRLKHPFDTLVEGVGLNRLTKNFSLSTIDKAFYVSDVEAIHMCRFLAEQEGLFVGSSSGLNCAATVKAIRHYNLKGARILTVLCDSGSRYLTKFYDPNFFLSTGLDLKYEKLDYKNLKNLDFVK